MRLQCFLPLFGCLDELKIGARAAAPRDASPYDRSFCCSCLRETAPNTEHTLMARPCNLVSGLLSVYSYSLLSRHFPLQRSASFAREPRADYLPPKFGSKHVSSLPGPSFRVFVCRDQVETVMMNAMNTLKDKNLNPGLGWSVTDQMNIDLTQQNDTNSCVIPTPGGGK